MIYGPQQVTPEEQLEYWLEGYSYCPSTNRECCPDFSCCNPELLAPADHRRVFVEGNAEIREGMCMSYLGGLIATLPKPEKIHIAGLTPDGDVH